MPPCKKCKKDIPDGAIFCPWCGMRQEKQKSIKKRGNGAGTVIKRGDTYTAIITLGYYCDPSTGKIKRKTRSKGGFRTKSEAVAYVQALKITPGHDSSITMMGLYEQWLPTYEDRIGKKTLACYKCAFKHFSTIHFCRFADLKTDDFQRCIDACPRGKSTKQDMRTIAGLLCKYAYSIDIISKNYAAYLHTGNEKKGTRPAFTLEELSKIRQAVGILPYADYVYFMCYTGFRPSEMFALKRTAYDQQSNTLVGGGKTKAGTDRYVTISPKLAEIMRQRICADTLYLFPREDGKKMKEDYFRKFCFSPLMTKLGIEGRTPYSCRHTFANLLKAVQGSDTDKAALMGHADASMTKYYQSEDIASLKAITDAI